MECTNCNHQLNGKYCSNCGRPMQLPRIDSKYLIREIGGVLSFCSFIYTILQQLLHFEDGYVRYSSDTRSTALVMVEWIQRNYGYANIVLAIFIAGWIKIMFRKHHYNFYEILILLLFVFGESMLIYGFFGILQSLTNLDLMSLSGMAGFVYSSWAIGQFFDRKKIANYFKAFLSYLLGLLSAIITVVLLGTLIDLITKH